MEQLKDRLHELHDAVKYKDKPNAESRPVKEVVGELRDAAALIAHDAVAYMEGDLMVAALAMVGTIADFCNEYEKGEEKDGQSISR